MGLKKFVNSLNNEMFVPKVESCNCEEPEVEYVDPTSYQEATDNVLEQLDNIEEAGEATDELEKLIEEKAILAQDSTTKDIPLEEQIIVQEALRYYASLTNYQKELKLSTESLTNKDTYTANLEDLKDILNNLKETAMYIWDAIVSTVKALIEELRKYIPTKTKNIAKYIEELKIYRSNSLDKNTLEYNFNERYGNKYVATSQIFMGNDKTAYLYRIEAMVRELRNIEQTLNSSIQDDINNVLKNNKTLGIKLSSNVDALVKKAANQVGYAKYFVYSVKPSGRSLYCTLAYTELNGEEKFGFANLVVELDSKIILDFSIDALVKELSDDRALLLKTESIMNDLKSTAEHITRTIKGADAEVLKVIRGNIQKQFKALFQGYISVINNVSDFDIAKAKTILTYVKRIKR